MSVNKNLPIGQLYTLIENALFADKKILISVTYKVAAYEDDGMKTPALTTKHVGKVVAASIEETTSPKRLTIYLAGRLHSLEISNNTETYIEVEN